MKKLLALVLALVMTLSLAVSANAAFKDAEKVNASYAKAVDVLSGMKCVPGLSRRLLPARRQHHPRGSRRDRLSSVHCRCGRQAGFHVRHLQQVQRHGWRRSWAAGYISYCANAELVKGYPDGTFKPSGNVTGYEVLAMILRVVGYDKNNEFSGADWALNVAKYRCSPLGILDNVDKSTDLSAPASRELVAELLFQAIQVPTVTYTPAFGYQADKVQKLEQVSIGYKNFKLASDDSEDAWGRPTTKWYKDSDKDLQVRLLRGHLC